MSLFSKIVIGLYFGFLVFAAFFWRDQLPYHIDASLITGLSGWYIGMAAAHAGLAFFGCNSWLKTQKPTPLWRALGALSFAASAPLFRPIPTRYGVCVPPTGIFFYRWMAPKTLFVISTRAIPSREDFWTWRGLGFS